MRHAEPYSDTDPHAMALWAALHLSREEMIHAYQWDPLKHP
jgi:hypothetical protein